MCNHSHHNVLRHDSSPDFEGNYTVKRENDTNWFLPSIIKFVASAVSQRVKASGSWLLHLDMLHTIVPYGLFL